MAPNDKFFEPQMQDILGGIFHVPLQDIFVATPTQDREEATDLILSNGTTVGCRVRSYNTFRDYRHQFVLRRQLASGAKTELTKILEGYCNVYLYAFCDKSEKCIISWELLDMDVFRYEVEHHIWYLKWQDVGSGRAFSLLEFPPSFVIKYFNNNYAAGVQVGKGYIKR